MPLKLFLSHSNCDLLIAQAVKKAISDAFEGHIDIYLAVDEVAGRVEWKRELASMIEQSDGILSILTPESINSPWIYIEWAPFWLNNKKIYTLVDEKILVKDLIDPMRDFQCTNMVDLNQVKKLFKQLRDDCGNDQFPVPYEFVSLFIREINFAQQKKQSELFEIYKDQLMCLPSNDSEKIAIANYFLAKNDHSTFVQVVQRIHSEDKKLEYANQLFMHTSDDLVNQVLETISASDRLTLFAFSMIDKAQVDTKLFRWLIDDLSKRSQVETRKVIVHLAELGMEDSQIFDYACSLIHSSPEIRKVIVYFINNNLYMESTFNDLVDICAKLSRPELRKVAIEFIVNDLYRTEQFRNITFILFKSAPTQGKMVMEELFKKSPDEYHKLWTDVKKKEYSIEKEIFLQLENCQFDND